jgi:hypothetical protein
MATLALSLCIGGAQAAQHQPLMSRTESPWNASLNLDPPEGSFSALSEHGARPSWRMSGQADDDHWDGRHDWGRFGGDDGGRGDSGFDDWHDDDHGAVSAVPEASSWILMASGGAFLGLLLARKSRSS